MSKLQTEDAYPRGGREVVLDVEIRGQIIEMKITCPTCSQTKMLIAEDHSLMYCGQCGTVMANRTGDYVDTSQITWKV